MEGKGAFLAPKNAPPVLVVSVDPDAWRQPYVRNLLGCLAERFRLEALTVGETAEREVQRLGYSVRAAETSTRAWPLRAIVCRSLSVFLRVLKRILPQVEVPRGGYDGTHIAIAALALRAPRHQEVVAIDLAALLAAQLAGQRAHLVSLELLHNDVCLLLLRPGTLKSVVTQNAARFGALLPEGGVPAFLVPNFPSFKEKEKPQNVTRKGWVFSGALRPGFGLWSLLDLIDQSPEEQLTILGRSTPDTWREVEARYARLLASGRVVLRSEYLDDDEHVAQVATHRVGFSLYEPERHSRAFFGPGRGILPWSHQNFWTGFPGKIGMYAAGGVPVVATDFPGTQFVRDLDIGVLVSDSRPDALREAVATVERRHDELSRNCLALARRYSFREHLEPFLDMLTSAAAKSTP